MDKMGEDMMKDGHVHLERGPYTKEWMSKFVKQAKNKGINQLYIVEHTHRFREFEEIYESIFKEQLVAKEQVEWFYKSPKLRLEEYTCFVEEMKKEEWGIEIYYGLEVCYFPEQEVVLKEKLKSYQWDFLIGSVHWIDGWGFDNSQTKWSWEQKNKDDIYERYYEVMIQLVESRLFTQLGHPDSIKCFGYYPTKDLKGIYERLARVLKENEVSTEFSSGLYINYGHIELGPNKELLKSLLKYDVKLVTVSDAHRPEDVGAYIQESLNIIEAVKKICIQE